MELSALLLSCIGFLFFALTYFFIIHGLFPVGCVGGALFLIMGSVLFYTNRIKRRNAAVKIHQFICYELFPTYNRLDGGRLIWRMMVKHKYEFSYIRCKRPTPYGNYYMVPNFQIEIVG